MSDHRRLQRALFRMQLDPLFAEAVRRGEAEALTSTGLDAGGVAPLREACPAGVSADPGGRRRLQVLGNVASEHVLTTWRALVAGADPELLESFPSSRHFHACVSSDGRLPLALAAHAIERAEASGDALLAAFASLEATMVEARRSEAFHDDAPDTPDAPDGSSGPNGRAGGVALSPRARLVRLPRGTHERATLVRHALDEGREPRCPALPGSADEERLLVQREARPARHRLAQVEVELLEGLTAELLAACEAGLDAAGLDAFCAAHDVERGELDAFLDELARDGVVQRAKRCQEPSRNVRFADRNDS